MTDFTFYSGAASGSGRKAMKQLLVDDVMINYATQNNKPWQGIDNLFVDCGGYSFMAGSDTGEYETSDSHYLDYIEAYTPKIWALRDYPCEPDVLTRHDRTVEEHQQMTTERHVNLLDETQDRGLDPRPLSVIQGWGTEQYLNHIDELRDHGALTSYVGIGSVCRRHGESEITDVIYSIRDALPSRYDLHAFGVKVSVLKQEGIVEALTSSDSQAFEFSARYKYDPCTWRAVSYEWLRYQERLDEILSEDPPDQIEYEKPLYSKQSGESIDKYDYIQKVEDGKNRIFISILGLLNLNGGAIKTGDVLRFAGLEESRRKTTRRVLEGFAEAGLFETKPNSNYWHPTPEAELLVNGGSSAFANGEEVGGGD